MPSAPAAVQRYVHTFGSLSVPSEAYDGAPAPSVVLSALGVSYPITSIGPRARAYGAVRGKTRPVKAERALLTPASLAAEVRTRYAYLLRAAADGTHYLIDLTALAAVRMRKRYQALGCLIRLPKDLSSAEVVPSDPSVPAGRVLRIAQVALAVHTLLTEAVAKVWQTVAPAFAAGVSTRDGEPSATQQTLFPFQSSLSGFLQKVDAFLLAPKGLLYHLTGMEYDSMIAYLKGQLGAAGALPTDVAADPVLGALPVIRLGAEYFANLRTYVDDAVAKGHILVEELKAVLARFYLPEAWTPVQRLTYVLWNLSYYHTLLTTTVKDVFTLVGSFITVHGDTLFQGLIAVVDAFKALLSFRGTSLVASAEVVASPALARKFISLREAVEHDEAYADVRALAPARVALSPA
jgi:hypothetical protein